MVQGGIVAEDGPLECLKLTPWLDPELIDQSASGVPVGLECLAWRPER